MQWTPGARPTEARDRPYRGVLEALQERVRPFVDKYGGIGAPVHNSIIRSGSEMLPGVGDLVGVEDLQAAAQDNDWGGIGLGLLAAIPGIPAIGRGARGGARTARRAGGLIADAAPSGGLMTGGTEAEAALARYRAANPDDTGARVLNPGDEGYPTNAQWDEASQAYVAPVEPDYPIRAFHGSPHSFDRFSLDKIGTGEGAQAYGHGLYFAESEDVARQYRNNLTRDVQYRADGSVWNPQNELQHLNVRAAANQNGDDLAATLERAYEAALRAEPGGQAARAAEADIAHLEAIRDSGGLLPNRLEVNGRPLGEIYNRYELRADNGSFPEAQKDYDRLALLEQLQIDGDPYDILGSRRGDYSPEALDWFESEIVPGFKRPGSMYEVGINAHPDTFLDWDRPLSEQPAGPRIAEWARGVGLGIDETDSGAYAVKQIQADGARRHGGRTQPFLDNGINGIRYLDGNSRGVGEGSSNYVVFNDELVKILRKYGISGLGLSGGAALGGGLIANQEQSPAPVGL